MYVFVRHWYRYYVCQLPCVRDDVVVECEVVYIIVRYVSKEVLCVFGSR